MRRNRTKWTNNALHSTPGRIVALVVVAALALIGVPPLIGPSQAATTFIVSSTADTADVLPGDGVCLTSTAVCTLRAAIQEANALAGDDTIQFALPGGAAAAVITPLSPLPPITQPLIIDGFSQTGSVQNTAAVGNNGTLAVELSGTNLVTVGLQIQSTVSLHGLSIGAFTVAGVQVSAGTGATFGGNYIGLTRSGDAAKPNGVGIEFTGTSSGARVGATVIGGAAPSARNVVSGNTNMGILIGGNTTNPRFTNNYIGTDKTGLLPLPNGAGIVADGVGSTVTGLSIGDVAVNFPNVISGNNGSAIVLGTNASGSYVAGNYVGVGVNGTTLGNGAGGGPAIDIYSDNNVIGSSSSAPVNGTGFDPNGNIIANNPLGGVRVFGTGNAVRANSMYANGVFGIFQGNGVFANDLDDADTGPNNQQNWPDITNARITGGLLSFDVAIGSSAAFSAYPIQIEVFVTSATAPFQGRTFFYRIAKTGGPGSLTISGVNASAIGANIGDDLVATATDANGNTSQFSPIAGITSGGFVVNSTLDLPDAILSDGLCDASAGTGICTLRAAIMQANNTATNPGFDSINFNIAPLDGTVKTINLTSALPDVTDNLIIQGESQNGSSCNSWPFALKVAINGNSVPGTILRATTGRLLANALIINRGAGGSTATLRLSGSNSVLQCMHIGTNAAGTATQAGAVGTPNGASVLVEGSTNIIGGTAANQRNVIGDEASIQIQIAPGANNNTVQNNSIGVSPAGAPITHSANWFQGVYVAGNNNAIGGRLTGQANVIANMNNGDGVWVGAGTGNSVVANSIYNNSALGIKIDDGNNQDAGDPDAGPNNKQNVPVMTAATIDGSGNFIATATIDSTSGNSTAPMNFDFFKTDGVTNQGKAVVGWNVIGATPGGGQIGFLASASAAGLTVGDKIVATMTDANGNTSQFSAPITITGPASGAYVVDSTGDAVDATPGDGICSTGILLSTCTLRAALQEANAHAGPDVINFNLPGGGVQTLSPAALPIISQTVTVDGYTQPGATANTLALGSDASLRVELKRALQFNGAATAGSIVRGLVINGAGLSLQLSNATGVTISGNYIGTNAAGTAPVGGSNGIFLSSSSGNVIGGNTPADRNLLSGNARGVYSISGSNNNRIVGNYIGTNAAGTTAVSNSTGVALTGGNNNEVGGTGPGEGNLISGNTYGIAAEGNLTDAGESNLKILGNRIGTNAAGNAAVPNSIPILAGAPVGSPGSVTGLRIGDGTVVGRNVISGNSGNGITLAENVVGALIQGNYIGVAADGTTALGNGGDGVTLGTSGPVNGTVVGSGGPSYTNSGSFNVIAYNGGAGINVQNNGTGNALAGNSFANNDDKGILLGVGPANDVGDADTGPNNYQNSPVLTLAPGSSQISWTGDFSNPGGLYVIAFYEADGGISGEGQRLAVVDTGFSTSGILPNIQGFGLTAGDKIVATATDAVGNTSQFSNIVTYSPVAVPIVVDSTGDAADTSPGDGVCATNAAACTLRAAIQETNALAGADVINFGITPFDGAVKTIVLSSPLPLIVEALTIDGTTQNGASCAVWPPTLRVAIDGGAVAGRLIHATAGALTLRGVAIKGGASGDSIVALSGTGSQLRCNFIGTNAAGTSTATGTAGASTGTAVLITATGTSNTIGGPLPTDANLISAEANRQISVLGNANIILGNRIGVAANGAAITRSGTTAWDQGIFVLGNANQIGGATAGQGNRVASFAQGIQIDLGNGNSIRGNSISGSSISGIDLTASSDVPARTGISFNHAVIPPPALPIVGGNRYQNYPVLNGATFDGTKTRVIGTLVSTPSRAHQVDLFTSPTCNASSFGDGLIYLGNVSVTTDANGNGSFDVQFPVGLAEPAGVTSTATDMVSGDTSEFSYCRPASTINLTWVAAQTVGNSATTPQFITDRLQEKWFKIPVSPGAKVKVTLTSPAGSALSLHSDPTLLYNESLNPSSAAALSAEAADFAFLPSGYLPSGYLPSGYLPSGYLPSGYLPSGYLADGALPSGYLPSGYLPSGYLPSGYLPSGYLPSGYLPSGYLPSGYLPSGYLPDAYANASRRSLLGISMDPKATVQTLERNTFELSGDVYVRVVGPFDPANAFTVRVDVNGGVCAGLASISGSLPTPSTANPQTVIVTDSTRIAPTVPGDNSVATAVQSLRDLAALPDVNGVVVDLGTGVHPRVAAARTQADANKACPAAQNALATEIKRVIDSYRSPALKYVVLAGGTEAIPYYQVSDVAGLANEKDYIPPVDPLSASEGSLRSGMVAGQDFYGSQTRLAIGGRTITVPGLAVGRLVDTAKDITDTVAQYRATGGVVAPQSSLITGYDFVGDTARKVVSELTPGGGIANDTLIQDPGEAPSSPSAWTATQLRTKLLSGNHDLIYLSGHFSAGNLLAADYKTTVGANEIQQSTVDLRDTVVVALGCHSGYSITKGDLLSAQSPDPDWAKAFLRKGSAAYIAATGYAYGDTELSEYGERLVLELQRQMRTGTGPISIGEALVNAKQAYLASLPQLTGIDEKTLASMTLFGLPMMKIDMPANNRITNATGSIVSSAPDVLSGPGVAVGLSAAELPLGSQLTQNTKSLVNISTNSNITTTYFSGKDGVVARPFEPLLPKEINDVTVGGKVLRGIAMTGGSYVDQTVIPLTSSVSIETSGIHQSYNSDVFYPNQTWSANYFDAVKGGSTRLITTPAQYRSTSTGSIDGTLRTYPTMNFRLYYLPSTWPAGSAAQRAAALSPSPQVYGASGEKTGGNLTFRVNARTDGSAGTQAVWVLYTATSGPLFGNWAKLDLARDANDPNSWVSTVALGTGTPAANIRFMVQAVNGAGVPTLETNLGSFYTPIDTGAPVPPPAVATQLSFATVPSSVGYLQSGTYKAVLSNTGTSAGLAGKTVIFDIAGQQVAATTNSAGEATVTAAPAIPTGSYTVSATFRGDTAFLSSTAATRSFVVVKDSTTLSLTPPSSTVSIGSPAGIKAALRDSSSGPLGGKSVVFVVRTALGGVSAQTVSVIADIYGNATLGALTVAPGTYDVQAYFASGPLSVTDENYVGSTSTVVELIVAVPVAPTITASAQNADNSAYVANTWTKQNVTVSYVCSVANCPPSQTVTAEGTTVVGPVTVTAPNSATASITFGNVKIDRIPPTITVTTPAANATFSVGQVVTPVFTCADALSGSAVCVVATAVNTVTPGAKTFTVNATDVAGNTFTRSVSYTVTAVVGSAAPVVLADFGVAGLQSMGFQSNIVILSGSFTDADGAPPYTATVRWTATGSFSPLVLNNNANFVSAFAYPSAGLRTVTVRVCDKFGNCGTDDVAITAGVTQKVTPRVVCVVDRGTATNPRFQARFGYTNAASIPLYVPTIPLVENSFSVNPYTRGQPQIFMPGTQANVFLATFQSGSISWRLNNVSATASSGSLRCPP